MGSWLRRHRPNRRVWPALSWLALATLILVLASAGSQLFLGRAWGLVPTSGQAMAPRIRSGGMLLCIPYGPGEPRVGDIIVFRPWSMDHDLCRRIIGIMPQGWLTQGDGLGQLDQELGVPVVSRKEIHGYVPQLGSLPLWVPGIGVLGAQPGSRGRLIIALAAALVMVAVPPARAAGKRLSPRRRRVMALSRAWVYGGAATICIVLVVGATLWVGGHAEISLESEYTTLARSVATGPVDIGVSPSAGRVMVRNDSPLALLVLAYAEPQGDARVDRPFAVVPARGSQAFSLVSGRNGNERWINLAYAPAVVPADWLYPLAGDWGPVWGVAALAVLQFGVAALVLCGFDLALASIRR